MYLQIYIGSFCLYPVCIVHYHNKKPLYEFITRHELLLVSFHRIIILFASLFQDSFILFFLPGTDLLLLLQRIVLQRPHTYNMAGGDDAIQCKKKLQ